MKKLHFTYDMQIEYSVLVSRCNFTIKCFPKDNLRQKIEGVQIRLSPPARYSWGCDGLKNTQIYGVNEQPHRTFLFHIEGNAVTGLSDAEEERDDDLDMIYRQPHGLNVAGEKLLSYYESIKPREELSDYEKATEIMHRLHRDFSYQPCTTNVDTSAEEAFSLGHGVCQDYAHIFIALLHLCKIPARYVTGLIIGEGASHAWVEILCGGKWYGLDPTNDTFVECDHIKIGVGRDAKDCMINRGIMHGGGLHVQTIHVTVTETQQ